MKAISSILIVTILLFSFGLNAQNKEEKTEVNINSVEITVDSVDELNSIDWDDLMSVFRENAPKDSIRMAIQLKDIKEFKTDSNGTKIDNLIVAVGGITEDLDELKNKLRKSTKAMIKVINKMKEQE